MIDYRFRPPKNEVMVGIYIDTKQPMYLQYIEKCQKAADKHDIQCTVNYHIDHIDDIGSYLIKHAIVLTDDNPTEATEKHSHLLDYYHSLSLCLHYPNTESMLQWRAEIEKLKSKYKNKINYLRPDIQEDSGHCLVSQQKLVDNLICDTVRIKYIPAQIQENISIPKTIQAYFKSISSLYTAHHLYHRSASDGFISVRANDGFYITATKTDKSYLDLSRISLVHDYNRDTNTIHYSGTYLPSSDVVEAAIVYAAQPNITAIVHTHASDLFTRNPAFNHKIKVNPHSYGIAELGDEINKEISKHLGDFIILAEHGEVFALTESLKNLPEQFKVCIESALCLV